MKGIRPFAREDIPQVASLYELTLRSGKREVLPGFPSYFERIFFEHPWLDPEIPSLVYEDADGKIAGFIGAHVRRMTFEGKPIRVGVCSQLIADPEVRSMAVGAFLLRKFMMGPQDMTFMETCSDGIRLMWENMGGHSVHLNSLNFTRFFRPSRFMANQLINRSRLSFINTGNFDGSRLTHRSARPAVSLVRGAADLFDIPLKRLLPVLKFQDTGLGPDDLTPESYLEHLPAIAGKRKLVPAYDLEFLRWQWFEMAQVKSKGELHGSLVRDEEAQVIGWYLYQVTPGDKGHIIQVEAKRGDEATVLQHLYSDAKHRGATLLHGRVEPNLQVPIVKENRCWIHSRYDRSLIHSRRSDILQAIYTGSAIFTRMEGEFWMGFHLEPFTESVANPYGLKSQETVPV